MNNFFLETHQWSNALPNHTALNGVSIQSPKDKFFGLLSRTVRQNHTHPHHQPHHAAPDFGEKLRFNGHHVALAERYSLHIETLSYPRNGGLYKKIEQWANRLSYLSSIERYVSAKQKGHFHDN